VATERSRELRALAERVAGALPETVSDAVLTGSTSRGVADEHSDVELLAIAETLPELDALPLEDAQSWSPPVEGAHWFGGRFDGEFVELVFWTPAYAEERVRAISAGEIVEHGRLRSAEMIANGVALRGRRHAEWVARLERYPDGLAAAIVEDVALDWFDPTSSYRALLREGDALVLAQRLVEDAQRILRLVFALNEEWEPDWKRVAGRVESLRVKPERVAERIDAAIRALDLAAMRALAAEALALAAETETTRRACELLLEEL
jgi:hypothetical protein